jgi:hypothetical protein
MKSFRLKIATHAKALFLTLLVSFAHHGLSQDAIPIFVSWSGQELKIGDTLTFVQGSSDYRFYQHLYLSTGERLWQKDVPTRKTIIKNFRKALIDNKQVTVAVIPSFPERGFFNVWIDIEKALKSGEVVGPSSQAIRFKRYKWISNEPLIYYLKLLELDVKPFAKEYMYRYDKKTYDKYRNDEFEFQEKQNAVAKQMQKQMDELRFDLPVCTGFQLELGEYDFEQQGFEVSFPKYLDILTEMFDDVAKTNVSVTFPRLKEVSVFKMDPNRAKEFIQSRKNGYGEINRKVICKVNFRFKDKLTSVMDEKIIVCLTGEVESVEMYGNMNKYSDDLGVIEF